MGEGVFTHLLLLLLQPLLAAAAAAAALVGCCCCWGTVLRWSLILPRAPLQVPARDQRCGGAACTPKHRGPVPCLAGGRALLHPDGPVRGRQPAAAHLRGALVALFILFFYWVLALRLLMGCTGCPPVPASTACRVAPYCPCELTGQHSLHLRLLQHPNLMQFLFWPGPAQG